MHTSYVCKHLNFGDYYFKFYGDSNLRRSMKAVLYVKGIVLHNLCLFAVNILAIIFLHHTPIRRVVGSIFEMLLAKPDD
jgi:hypothetical protein